MARFKIFPTLTKKVKKQRSSGFKKAEKSSVAWFHNKVKKTFGKRSSAGTFSREEMKAQQDAMNPRRIKARTPAEIRAEKSAGRRPSAIQAELKAQRAAMRRPKGVAPAPKGRTTRTRTPDQELSQGISSKSKVAANDPASEKMNQNRQINRQLKQNTTLGPEFKKNLKNTTGKPLIGHMYFYIYDPKWKKILPYFDVFPLVIPLDYYDDGFLGMNLHYLPYILRAQLLDWLMSLSMSSTVAGKESKYMAVSYGVLKGLAGSKNYEPTIKRYLYGHVKSPFAEVLHEEWENAAFLPVEQFRKASKREVWVESKKKV